MTRGELMAELAVTLEARHEARFIVEEVLGRTVEPATPVSLSDCDAARALALRRAGGEPLQYVLGHWGFRSLDLAVDPRVLIPRPETEGVVEVALGEVHQCAPAPPAPPAAPVLVDAGTGSGAIALSLATELAAPGAAGHVYAVDASPDALAVAGANLAAVRRSHPGSMLPVTLVEGSWLDALPGRLRHRVTVVVANPPYVAEAEWPHLPPDVRREPRGALVAGPGSGGTPGLGAVEALLRQAADWLARPGAVVIELAPHQAVPAAALARSLGYGPVRVEPDLARRPRTLVGRLR